MMENTNQTQLVGYFHICSDGNYSSVLFRDSADFKAAMNRLALLALRYRVTVLAFVLMDNHFHFVVKVESKDDATFFANAFKRLTGLYNTRKYGERASCRKLPVKMLPVRTIDNLKSVICYTLKNPTKARIAMFYNYPWGTGNLYFRCVQFGPETKDMQANRVKDMNQSQYRSMFLTHMEVPSSWMIRDGVILPENYVPVRQVENLFKTTRSFMFFLSMNNDDEIERDMEEWNEVRLPDPELRAARNEMIDKMFGKTRLNDLSAPQRMSLARALRKRYYCSKKQLARIVRLPYEELAARL